MSTVDDPAIILRVCVGLSTELETKIFDHIGRGASQGLGNAWEIGNDCLDAVAFAFDLGLQALHLVSIEGIGDIATNVDGSHLDGR